MMIAAGPRPPGIRGREPVGRAPRRVKAMQDAAALHHDHDPARARPCNAAPGPGHHALPDTRGIMPSPRARSLRPAPSRRSVRDVVLAFGPADHDRRAGISAAEHHPAPGDALSRA